MNKKTFITTIIMIVCLTSSIGYAVKNKAIKKSNTNYVADVNMINNLCSDFSKNYNKSTGVSRDTYIATMLARSLRKNHYISDKNKLEIIASREWPIASKPALICLLKEIASNASNENNMRIETWNDFIEQVKYFYDWDEVINAYEQIYALFKKEGDTKQMAQSQINISEYMPADQKEPYLKKIIGIAAEKKYPDNKIKEIKINYLLSLTYNSKFDEASIALSSFLNDYPDMEKAWTVRRIKDKVNNKEKHNLIYPTDVHFYVDYSETSDVVNEKELHVPEKEKKFKASVRSSFKKVYIKEKKN